MLIHCTMMSPVFLSFFFFFNDTATTEIYTLSLHDALPICRLDLVAGDHGAGHGGDHMHIDTKVLEALFDRSEEHTSELQSPCNLVCRLLLEKKKNIRIYLKLSICNIYRAFVS